MRHWLMKSEPDAYSIADLGREKRALWDGVRNYQARNFMRDEMQVGDAVLFYHSNATPPGVAGLARVSAPAQPDPTAFDKKSKYYDPKSAPEAPRWVCVEVEYVAEFAEILPLAKIRERKSLKDLPLLQRGQRLSIQPLSKTQYDTLVKMAGATR